MSVAAERLCSHLVGLEEDEVLVGLRLLRQGRDGRPHENRQHFEVGVEKHVVHRGGFGGLCLNVYIIGVCPCKITICERDNKEYILHIILVVI